MPTVVWNRPAQMLKFNPTQRWQDAWQDVEDIAMTFSIRIEKTAMNPQRGSDKATVEHPHPRAVQPMDQKGFFF